MNKLTHSNPRVIVENDSTAAAAYEARVRLGKNSDGLLKDFVLIRSGTGIGVGLVLDNEVYLGSGETQGFVGEFGHMTIVAGGKPCVCGNRGCWERYKVNPFVWFFRKFDTAGEFIVMVKKQA